MTHWQHHFYDPCLASDVTKHAAQLQAKTTEMMTEMTTYITMETKMKMATAIPLLDQDPMVQSSIWSWHLGLAEDSRVVMATALWPRKTIYISVGLYIYPIKNILKMCHKFGMCIWNYFRTNYLHVQLCNLDTSFFVFVQLFSKLVLHVFSTATSWTGYTCSS